MEARMFDVSAVAHQLRIQLGRVAAYLRGMRQALGLPTPLDPELEEWARSVFGELRKAPLVQPSRDVVAAVMQRLKEIDSEGSTRDRADHEQTGHE
jgi:hypothetical protein